MAPGRLLALGRRMPVASAASCKLAAGSAAPRCMHVALHHRYKLIPKCVFSCAACSPQASR